MNTHAPRELQRFLRLFVFVCAAVAGVTLIRLALSPFLELRAAFSAYVLAVLLCGYYYGWRGGIGATVLSAAAAYRFFVWPQLPFHWDPRSLVNLSVYVVVGMAATTVAVRLREALERAKELAKEKEHTLQELREALGRAEKLAMERARVLEQLRKALGRAEMLAQEKGRALEKLQVESAKVHTLEGLLPVCSGCRKIRDDQGHWEGLENYVRGHSAAQFTHSFCPDCAARLHVAR